MLILRGRRSVCRFLAVFGLDTPSPLFLQNATIDSSNNHILVPVRFKQKPQGPTTRRILALENVASWKQNEVPEERTKSRAHFDIIPRKSRIQRAKELVDAVVPLPDVKEEIFAACDTWVAWELEFPIIPVKMAIHRLCQLKQWRRVIQVTKWMVSKGQGLTMGTYGTLIRALDIDGRLEEVEDVWYNIVVKRQEAVPKIMYARMIRMYEQRGLPDKMLKMFRDLERAGTRPDSRTVFRVGAVYEKLGFPNKTAELIEKHKPPERLRRYRHRVKKPRFPLSPPPRQKRREPPAVIRKKKLRARLAAVIDY